MWYYTINIFSFCTGDLYERGFINGVGYRARFDNIRTIINYKNGSELIVADLYNNCIRQVNRHTSIVTTFAGICATDSQILHRPREILYRKEKDLFYYLLKNSSIVEHDVVKGKIKNCMVCNTDI